MIRLYPADAV